MLLIKKNPKLHATQTFKELQDSQLFGHFLQIS